MYRIQYTEYSINVDTLIFLLHEIATNKRCPQLFLLDLPRMRCNRYWHYCVVCTKTVHICCRILNSTCPYSTVLILVIDSSCRPIQLECSMAPCFLPIGHEPVRTFYSWVSLTPLSLTQRCQ